MHRKRSIIAVALIYVSAAMLTPQPAVAIGKGQPTFYDRHVLFDNSSSRIAHASSHGWAIAPSTLELVGALLPVATDRFVSPPNAVRLSWTSATGGDWQATIEVTRRYARPFRFEGGAVTFWCYSERELTASNAPLIFLRDVDDNGTPAIAIVQGDAHIPAQVWTQVSIPFETIFGRSIRGTDDSRFRVGETLGITFMQGLDAGERHTLYVDDIHIRDVATGDEAAPPPTNVAAKAYERHFALSWQPSGADDVLAYRIHRSTDGGTTFTPIGTQQGSRTRFVDFVGAPSTQAS